MMKLFFNKIFEIEKHPTKIYITEIALYPDLMPKYFK